jgi:hypothetical protein
MTKNGLRVLDSDRHIMEPPDLSERYIDREFKHRAPRGVTSANVRDLRMIYPDGRDWGRQQTARNRTFLSCPSPVTLNERFRGITARPTTPYRIPGIARIEPRRLSRDYEGRR